MVILQVLLVFGLPAGNYGTSLRHRAKYVSTLIVLASPRLPRVKLHHQHAIDVQFAVGITCMHNVK